ncbi:MAG: response regulator, partial [Kofleriaceae bacterium]
MGTDETTREIDPNATPASGSHVHHRILIVDHDPFDREALCAILSSQHYDLSDVETGPDAIAMVAEQLPDLIVVDVMLPGMDGYELVRALKADPITRPIPIVMVSTLQDRRALLRALHAGAADLLRKPVDASELRARIKNLLRLKAQGDVQNQHGLLLEAKVDVRTAELVASERLYRETFDDAPVGIVHVNMDGHWVRVNQRLCDLLGYSREELLLPSIQALVLANVTAGMETTVAQVQQTSGRHLVSEDRLRRQDGRLIWTRINMTVHCRADGISDHLILVLEDITQERALEAQFRQASKMDAL